MSDAAPIGTSETTSTETVTTTVPVASDLKTQSEKVLLFLGAALLVFTVGHALIGLVSLYRGDGQGVNAVRGDMKDCILYILGVLSGMLVPHRLK